MGSVKYRIIEYRQGRYHVEWRKFLRWRMLGGQAPLDFIKLDDAMSGVAWDKERRAEDAKARRFKPRVVLKL